MIPPGGGRPARPDATADAPGRRLDPPHPPLAPAAGWDLALLVLAYLATRLPFVYVNGFPDGDQSHIALGIYDAVRSGTLFGGVMLYGATFSTGYYALLFALAPLYRGDPAALVLVINGLGAVAGLVATVALWKGLRALWGRSAALGGSLLWLFVPGWWELNTFGHPTALAATALICSLWAWVAALPRGGPARPGRLGVAMALFAAAVLFRADLLLAAGVFPAVAWFRGRRPGPALALGTGAVAVAIAALYVTRSLVYPEAAAGPAGGLFARVLALLRPDPPAAGKLLGSLVLGLGPVLFVAGILGWLACARERESRAALIVAAAGLVPELAWWLQVEGSFRHFLVASLFFLLPAARALAGWRPSRVVLAGLALLVLNQGVMWAARPWVLASYPWAYQAAAGAERWSSRAPLGDWYTSHRAAVGSVDRELAAARWLAGAPRSRVVVVTPMPYRFELEILVRAETYRHSLAADGEAVWISLHVPGRHYLFLSGAPEATRSALGRAFASGRLAGYSIFVPPGAMPTRPFVFPPDYEVLPDPTVPHPG